MNGARALLETLLASQVEVCFGNPGTSEIQFIAALETAKRMRCVLGLQEGVLTGAADGYARMADRPAATLLHLGPGLANGLGNLHNARRAGSPIINIVGEHATWHRAADAPLTSDIAALARPVSDWVRTVASADRVSSDAADAIEAACAAPGKIATLIVPADAAWSEVTAPMAAARPAPRATVPSDEALDTAARALQSGERSVMLLSGRALRAKALELAGRIASRTGCRLLAPTHIGRAECGAGRLPIARIPFVARDALKLLADMRHAILVGAKAPVAFFAYPDVPSALLPVTCRSLALAAPEHDLAATLAALAERVGALREPLVLRKQKEPGLPHGALTAEAVLQIVARLLPEQAIIVDESISSGRTLFSHTDASPPHDYLQLTGGALGSGLPMAVGAAVACPERKVICLEGDGSGLFGAQALWTQARERLNVVTIIFANGGYQILRGEMRMAGVNEPGARTRRMIEINDPPVDWVGLARSLGVEASRAERTEDFAAQLKGALAARGPYLIEARL